MFSEMHMCSVLSFAEMRSAPQEFAQVASLADAQRTILSTVEPSHASHASLALLEAEEVVCDHFWCKNNRSRASVTGIWIDDTNSNTL